MKWIKWYHKLKSHWQFTHCSPPCHWNHFMLPHLFAVLVPVLLNGLVVSLVAAQILFELIKAFLISHWGFGRREGNRQPERVRISVIGCSHTHALNELLTKTCLCGVLLIDVWWKAWTYLFLNPTEDSQTSLFQTHTRIISLSRHIFSAWSRYDNTGGLLKTLSLLISALNTYVCF